MKIGVFPYGLTQSKISGLCYAGAVRLTENPNCNPACQACHYKDLTYPEQLVRKESWARKQLEPWKNVLQPLAPAPTAEQLGYRSKTWLRSHWANHQLSFGMYRAVQSQGKWTQEFVGWDTCPLHSAAILTMTERLRNELAANAPAFAQDALFGVWMGAPHLVLVCRENADLTQINWAQLIEAPFTHVWLHRTNQVGKKIFQHREFHKLYGPEPETAHPILAFRQMAQTLLNQTRKESLAALLEAQPLAVLDLYCGVGEISTLLPDSVGWLGVELSGDAAQFANQRRPRAPLQRCLVGTLEARLADPQLAATLPSNYSLYLNPPRPGVSALAMERLLLLMREKPPARMVYMSCSASSLARDLRAFEAEGWKVESLRPFDFFPQTEHFETLAILKLPNSNRGTAAVC